MTARGRVATSLRHAPSHTHLIRNDRVYLGLQALWDEWEVRRVEGCKGRDWEKRVGVQPNNTNKTGTRRRERVGSPSTTKPPKEAPDAPEVL